MATVRFDYPTAAAATVSITLPQGGSLVGDGYSHHLNQTVEETPGKNVVVNRRGAGKANVQFSLRCLRSSLTETDRADVINFIDTTVQGASNTFQWTDVDGTVRTVRCLNETLDFRRFAGAGENIIDICNLLFRVED